MVIGNGDIASVLPDSDLLFFASGVSNSQEKRDAEFRRERDLLIEQDRLAHLVYFSSLAIFYDNTHYTRHKLQMEGLVKRFFPSHTIVRLGNIDWGTNPKTLINYLRANPDAEIRDEYRYITDKDEFLHWINLIPDFNCELNITGRRLTVQQIKEQYVDRQNPELS